LNWLARCCGATSSENVPLAPNGIGRMLVPSDHR
jgi:hypothetical protein